METLAQVVAVSAAAVSAIAACFAGYFGFRSARESEKLVRASFAQLAASRQSDIVTIHATLQDRIRELQRSMPPEVNDPHWVPGNEHDRILALYWYRVFDEWFLGTKWPSDFGDLWQNHYAEGVRSALRRPAFAVKIRQLIKAGNSWLGCAESFRNEIDSLHFQVHKRRLFDGEA